MRVGRTKLGGVALVALVGGLIALAGGVAGCGGSKHIRSTATAPTVPSPVYLDCETARNVAVNILGNAYGSLGSPSSAMQVVSSGERQAASVLQHASRKLYRASRAGGTDSASARSFASKLSILSTVLARLSRQAAAAHGSIYGRRPTAALRNLGGVTRAVGKTCPPRTAVPPT